MRVNLELNRSVVNLKTKAAWTDTSIEKNNNKYKTFILDKTRGILLYMSHTTMSHTMSHSDIINN